MIFIDQSLQTLIQDVGIDLRRGNIRMPQQLLNGAQIRTMRHQVARKGMA